MHITSTLAAVLAFVAAARAVPGGSPLCSVDGAAERLTAAMGANVGRIPCTITADKTSYTLGGPVTLTWACTDIDNFQGFLAYASSGLDASKKVGAFTLMDGLKSNRANCGDTAEQDNSVVCHSAPGRFSPSGSITYTAPATDQGELTFNFLVVKKVDTGFRWGIYPAAVKLASPGGSGAQGGATPAVDAFSCMCPTPSPISVIRKCTPKVGASTRVIMTKFKTMTETTMSTKTEVETLTETVRVTATCTGTVAGGESTPTTSQVGGGGEYGMTPHPGATPYPDGGYGGGYGGDQGGATPSPEGYGAYSLEEEEAMVEEDEEMEYDDA